MKKIKDSRWDSYGPYLGDPSGYGDIVSKILDNNIFKAFKLGGHRLPHMRSDRTSYADPIHRELHNL